MGGAVDLHSHTTASDGALAPRELVRLAVKHGVRVLAITDHDSTDGLADALDEARLHPPLRIVAGLEINCDVQGGADGAPAEIHVLGYEVEWEADWFQQFLRAQREERRERVYRMAERLGELGMPIDPAEVLALVKEGSAGRPHVARVMVRRGYVKSVREAFDRYLRAGGPANVPRKRLAPADAVAVIRRARGSWGSRPTIPSTRRLRPRPTSSSVGSTTSSRRGAPTITGRNSAPRSIRGPRRSRGASGRR